MSQEKKNWLSALAFFIVLVMILALLSAIFNVKSVDTWPSSRVTTGFYEEPENTLDVLYFGTSHIMCGCSPMRVWQDHGITGYNLATERQYMGLTYYWVKEAFKYQSPKLVVLDAMTLFAWPFSTFESRQRKALDYMRLSQVKLEAIRDVCEYDEDADPLTYLLPFVAYHDRWSMLNESDFTFPFEDKKYISKGFYLCYDSIGVDFPEPFMPATGQREEFAKKTMEYFHMLVDLCSENGARLLLAQMPRSKEWTVEKDQQIRELAEEYGFDFVDFGTPEMMAQIEFYPPVDMFDPWHVSSFGADKITRCLGDYIAENYTFDPHDRQTIDTWNAESEIFDRLVEEDMAFRISERERIAREIEEEEERRMMEDLAD